MLLVIDMLHVILIQLAEEMIYFRMENKKKQQQKMLKILFPCS